MHDIGTSFIVVILTVNDSVKGAEQQIHYSENYKKMNKDLTTIKSKAVNKVMSILQDLISKNVLEDLQNENPRISHFHLKPNLHKCILRRPVTSLIL